MGEVSYAPLIKDMTWSYSRIKTFEGCKYKWFLKYIKPKLEDKEMFFANYGKFMHKLIEQYYNGEKSSAELYDTYLQDFRNYVVGQVPSQKVFESYFRGGLQYLKEFQPFPCNTIAVEKKIEFEIDGVKGIGYIDYLGEENNDLLIVDNKSKMLKHRSCRGKPTKTDIELDEYLKQLYIYSIAVEKEFGRLPSALCFNCFRNSSFIKEPFCNQAYADSKQWFIDKVNEITYETDFKPDVEFFKCKYLCEMQEHCDYFRLS